MGEVSSTVKTTLIVLATIGAVLLGCCGGFVALRFWGWRAFKDEMHDGLNDLEAERSPVMRPDREHISTDP